MADDPFFRPLPADPRPQPMPFQPHERPDRHADVVALRPCRPHLRPFHPALLLQRPMVDLDPPRELGVLQPLALAHVEIVRRPVLRVPGWGDNPEYLDHPIVL